MKFCNVKTDMACMNASTPFWSWRSKPYPDMGVCNKDLKIYRVLERTWYFDKVVTSVFFCFLVCVKGMRLYNGNYIKDMGFRCAIGPPITTSNNADFYSLEFDTF